MASKAIPLFKFVGTVSLGLLTGVSYAVSRLALPALLELPSASSARASLSHLAASLQTSLIALSSLAAAPLALAYAFAPPRARHPYLVYASLLAVLSAAAPRLLLGSAGLVAPTATTTTRPANCKNKTSTSAAAARARSMEASYEVLGDVHSEPASEEDVDEPVNGEDVRVHVQGLARAYAIQAGLAALGFAMSVVGLWGDGATVVIVS
uniref:Autophagy-related protein 33 n=1 Tax=Beauveria bassiana TaxID=176275 RepID=A0A345FAC4_BEABA|nr:autophagy-related protein 33 [Beauveria bassiana]